MPSNLIRAFIAIDLPAPLRKELDAVVSRFNALRASGVRWVAAANIHLTLKFLGESVPASLNDLAGKLKAVAPEQPTFSLRVAGLGAFPNPRRPRVIWVGLDASPELERLQQAIETQSALAGFSPDDRKFSPHLTLGRVQEHAGPEEVARITAALSQLKVGTLGELTVEDFHLIHPFPCEKNFDPSPENMLESLQSRCFRRGVAQANVRNPIPFFKAGVSRVQPSHPI
jgi:2'-5' RNA ligase